MGKAVDMWIITRGYRGGFGGCFRAHTETNQFFFCDQMASETAKRDGPPYTVHLSQSRKIPKEDVLFVNVPLEQVPTLREENRRLMGKIHKIDDQLHDALQPLEEEYRRRKTEIQSSFGTMRLEEERNLIAAMGEILGQRIYSGE